MGGHHPHRARALPRGYDPEALQVHNRRSRGGIYWFSAGWHPRATVSWALGAAVGLATVSTPLYEGPLLALTGGIDCSFVLSGLTGGLLYAVLTPAPERDAPGTESVPGVPAD